MPKQRSGTQGQQKRSGQSPGDARQVGMRHFQAGRLDQAIAVWQTLGEHPPVRTALAEVYFRRALGAEDRQRQVDDLRVALTYSPEDLRLRYQVGLALHRQGDLAAALEYYGSVASANPRWPGLALVQALAQIERGELQNLDAVPTLSAAERHMLAPALELIHGQTPPANEDGTDDVWRGIVRIQAGDAAGALAALADTASLPAKLATLRRYYLGVAAALGGDMATALAAWQKVYDKGYRPPWLLENLAVAHYQQLLALSEQGDLTAAANLAQSGAALLLVSSALNELQLQVLDRAAHEAARSGSWAQATMWWEAARVVLAAADKLGSPRSLLHNLALAYEAQERWVEAAEAWRAMLRTRPRKTARRTKDSPPLTGTEEAAPAAVGEQRDAAGMSDEQWSWVRRRVITCYKHAQEPGQAVTVFRQAIKAEPDDLDLRIQLADALLANDQPAAAYNELQRVIERDSNHPEARLRLAGYHLSQGQWYLVEPHLRALLAQQPKQPELRRQLGQMFAQLASQHNQFAHYDQAYSLFEEAARLSPQDYGHQLNLGRVALNRKQRDVALVHIEQALQLGNDQPEVYVAVLKCWVFGKDMEQARAVIARAEAVLPPTPDFYIDAGVELLESSARPTMPMPFGPPRQAKPQDDEWSLLGVELLDRAAALRPDDAGLRHQIASELVQVRPDLGLRYIAEAVRLAPAELNFQVLQALLQGLGGDIKAAKETLRKVIKLAKQQGNREVVASAEQLRREIGSPFFGMAFQMGSMFDELDLGDEFWM